MFTNSKGFANKTTLFSIVNDLGEIASGIVTPSLQCGMSTPNAAASSSSCALSNSNKTLTVSFTVTKGQGATLATSCSGGYISVNT